MGCCECNQENIKHKQRNTSEKADLIKRLNRVEGQVRGVRKMVEDDRYCVDIVTQISAIQAALNAFNKELLARHIKSCVADDIREGNEEAVDELCELLKKLMK
jgi:DNA-binding FrmR family transcriptional regulator